MRTIRPYGPRAFLVECASVDEVIALAAVERPAGVTQVIPGARSLVVECRDPATTSPFYAACVTTPLRRGDFGADLLEVPVVYDGEDLGDVARATNLSVDDVIAAHSGATYRVAFCGFVAGFAYCDGLPPRLHLPRRATPRPRVPALSVGIAAEWTGVYPAATPGGWHLLGTAAALPSLQPGMTVRFRAQ